MTRKDREGGLAVAVLGTGSIGSRHLRVLAGLEDTRLLAVPVRRGRGEELLREGYEVCASLEDAVQRGARAAIIATDTRRHEEDAIKALDLGLQVLVEKPLASDAEGAKRIRAAAGRNGSLAFVGCVLRFSESLRVFKSWLPEAGDLHTVHIECQSYLPDWRPERSYKDSYSARVEEGGVLRDLIHEVDYAGWLFGWPRSVIGSVRNLGRLGIAADEVADLMWESPRGAMVTMQLNYLTRPTRRGICAAGERGTLRWDAVTQTVEWIPAGGSRREIKATQERDAAFVDQSRAFLGACGGAPAGDLATVDDGVRALAICDAARRSSATRSEETAPYT